MSLLPPDVNSADFLSFSLKIICFFFFCAYWRNLRENFFARVAVGFGCSFAALDYFF